MIQTKKILNGVYEDVYSGRYIEFLNGKWHVLSVLGEVYYTSKTLKDCKIWQCKENQILSYNK